MSVVESQLVVGRYQLDQVIGAGGFADVYRARTVRGQVRRDVAVKILRPAPSMDRAGREISAQRQIHHPNVIPILDHGIVDGGHLAGRVWIAMPLAAYSLESRLRRGCLPDAEATELATAMIDALDAAHRHHVLHRDIKPDNILRYRDRWVLADFGIAATVEATNDHHMTVLAGSMGYMAPEMWFTGAVSSAVDVYALGVTMHRALTGEIPEPLQPGETWAARASRLLSTTPRCSPTLPARWRSFVEAACAPVDRRARTRDLFGPGNGTTVAPMVTATRFPAPSARQPAMPTAPRPAVPGAWQPAPTPSPPAVGATPARRRWSATRRGALVIACVAAALGGAAAVSVAPTRVGLVAVSASGLLLAITLFLLLRSLLRRGHFVVRLCWRGALSAFAATLAAYLLYPTGALGSVVDRRTARSITNVGVPLLPPAGDGALVDLSDVSAGDCVLAPAIGGLYAMALQQTPCTRPHNFEVTRVLNISSTSPPTVAGIPIEQIRDGDVCERPPGRGTGTRPRVVLTHSTRDNVVQHPYAVCVAFVPGDDDEPLVREHRFAAAA